MWPQAPIISSDSGTYLEVSADLKDFRIDRLHYRPPGYPLFLRLASGGELPTRRLFIFSLVLHFASIWGLASVLQAAGLPRAALGLFGVLLLLPPYVEPAAYVQSEGFSAFVLVMSFGGIVLWHSRRATIWLVLAALAIGYAGLVRPTYQALGVAVAGGLFVGAKLCLSPPATFKATLRAATVFASVSALPIGMYLLLNYARFGHVGLSLVSPVDSATLSTRTARVIERLPDEYAAVREVLLSARDADLLRRHGSHTGYGYLSSPGVTQELSKVTGLKGPELARYLVRLNLLLIRKAPLEYSYDVSRAFCLYWFPSATEVANFNSRTLQLLWGGVQACVITVFAATMLVLVGGIPYFLVYRRRVRQDSSTLVDGRAPRRWRSHAYMLAGIIVMYTALISSALETGDPRYRVPTDGLIVFMAFLGSDMCRRAILLAGSICAQADLLFRNDAVHRGAQSDHVDEACGVG